MSFGGSRGDAAGSSSGAQPTSVFGSSSPAANKSASAQSASGTFGTTPLFALGSSNLCARSGGVGQPSSAVGSDSSGLFGASSAAAPTLSSVFAHPTSTFPSVPASASPQGTSAGVDRAPASGFAASASPNPQRSFADAAATPAAAFGATGQSSSSFCTGGGFLFGTASPTANAPKASAPPTSGFGAFATFGTPQSSLSSNPSTPAYSGFGPSTIGTPMSSLKRPAFDGQVTPAGSNSQSQSLFGTASAGATSSGTGLFGAATTGSGSSPASKSLFGNGGASIPVSGPGLLSAPVIGTGSFAPSQFLFGSPAAGISSRGPGLFSAQETGTGGNAKPQTLGNADAVAGVLGPSSFGSGARPRLPISQWQFLSGNAVQWKWSPFPPSFPSCPVNPGPDYGTTRLQYERTVEYEGCRQEKYVSISMMAKLRTAKSVEELRLEDYLLKTGVGTAATLGIPQSTFSSNAASPASWGFGPSVFGTPMSSFKLAAFDGQATRAGSNSQSQSLFPTSSAAEASSGTGLFGAATTGSGSSAASKSLFGNADASVPASGPGLFSAPVTGTGMCAPSQSLFGSPAAGIPRRGSGLFNAPATSTGGSAQPQQLFGNIDLAAGSRGPGLFGNGARPRLPISQWQFLSGNAVQWKWSPFPPSLPSCPVNPGPDYGTTRLQYERTVEYEGGFQAKYVSISMMAKLGSVKSVEELRLEDYLLKTGVGTAATLVTPQSTLSGNPVTPASWGFGPSLFGTPMSSFKRAAFDGQATAAGSNSQSQTFSPTSSAAKASSGTGLFGAATTGSGSSAASKSLFGDAGASVPASGPGLFSIPATGTGNCAPSQSLFGIPVFGIPRSGPGLFSAQETGTGGSAEPQTFGNADAVAGVLGPSSFGSGARPRLPISQWQFLSGNAVQWKWSPFPPSLPSCPVNPGPDYGTTRLQYERTVEYEGGCQAKYVSISMMAKLRTAKSVEELRLEDYLLKTGVGTAATLGIPQSTFSSNAASPASWGFGPSVFGTPMSSFKLAALGGQATRAGSNSQSQSLFTTSSAAKASSGTGLFGAATTGSGSSAASKSLFGNAGASIPASGPGLFSAPVTGTGNCAPSQSLFGSPAAGIPRRGPGLFNAPATSTGGSAQPQHLFGNVDLAAGSRGPGLFGSGARPRLPISQWQFLSGNAVQWKWSPFPPSLPSCPVNPGPDYGTTHLQYERTVEYEGGFQAKYVSISMMAKLGSAKSVEELRLEDYLLKTGVGTAATLVTPQSTLIGNAASPASWGFGPSVFGTPMSSFKRAALGGQATPAGSNSQSQSLFATSSAAATSSSTGTWKSSLLERDKDIEQARVLEFPRTSVRKQIHPSNEFRKHVAHE